MSCGNSNVYQFMCVFDVVKPHLSFVWHDWPTANRLNESKKWANDIYLGSKTYDFDATLCALCKLYRCRYKQHTPKIHMNTSTDANIFSSNGFSFKLDIYFDFEHWMLIIRKFYHIIRNHLWTLNIFEAYSRFTNFAHSHDMCIHCAQTTSLYLSHIQHS